MTGCASLEPLEQASMEPFSGGSDQANPTLFFLVFPKGLAVGAKGFFFIFFSFAFAAKVAFASA